MGTSKITKVMSILLSGVFVLSSISVSTNENVYAKDYGISSPRVAAMTRETIYFGNYWQEDTDGNSIADQSDDKTPIRWQILEKYSDGSALVLSDKIIDAGHYDDLYSHKNIDWNYSDVREWLNNKFYNDAFSKEEKSIIIESNVVDTPNPYSNLPSKMLTTKDNIFLLSIDEVLKYGKNTLNVPDESMIAKTSLYVAINNPALCYNYGGYDNKERIGTWWLRTMGTYNDYFCKVDYFGQIDTLGERAYSWSGFRPAARVYLDSPYVKRGESINVAVKGCEWDTVVLGKYNEKKVSWRVLNVTGDDAFLLSETPFALETLTGSEDFLEDSWKNSKIRKNLNKSIYKSVFNDSEKNIIKTTEVINKNNPFYGTSGGGDTKDKLFLLSLNDVVNISYGFPEQYNAATDFRILKTHDTKNWYLRSPGKTKSELAIVGKTGYVHTDGDDDGFVRPAMHINLKSKAWKKGKTIKVGKTAGAKIIPLDSKLKTDYPIDDAKIPLAPILNSVNNTKGKSFTAKWKKVSSAKGYQIQYSPNKKFKKAKAKTTKKNSITIKKLKNKKVYYVRVRAYTINASGEKVYGDWSKVKKVKIKK